MFDDNVTYIEWDFEPYIPPRSDIPGESIFLQNWQTMVLSNRAKREWAIGENKYKIDLWHLENERSDFPILEMLPYKWIPTFHDTKIAARFMLWLGTNQGRAFVEDADKIADKHKDVEVAWLKASLGADNPFAQTLENEQLTRIMKQSFQLAWLNVNERIGVPGRYDWIPRDTLRLTDLDGKLTIEGSINDADIFEQCVKWLGTEMGQDYIVRSTAETSVARKLHWEAEQAARNANLRSMLGLTPK